MLSRVALVLGALLVFVGLHALFARGLERPARVESPARTIDREPLRPDRVTLLFVGDTGLGDAAEPTLRKQGYDFPLRATVDLVSGADLAIANLEMPITAGGRRFPLYKEYGYRSAPAAAGALAWAGFDVVSLANNHALDYGAEGLADTIAHAEQAGMAAYGAGPDEAAARRGVIATLGGVRVGLLAYCEHQLLWDLWVDQFARAAHPGTAALTEAALKDDVARLRPLVDVLVVSLHIGYNYEPPSADAIAWSRRAIDLGADLVVNHHPHLAHPVALERGRAIALSLGNYAFGTPGRPALDFGLMLFAELEGRRLARIELVPIDAQNRRVEFQPRPLVGAALDDALARIIAQSKPLGAALERRGDRAVLELADGAR